MRFRNSRLRTETTALPASLSALRAFAARGPLREVRPSIRGLEPPAVVASIVVSIAPARERLCPVR
ncbi:hypothetical protein [Actinomadura keratinilytica]|jgi:hypothetical protein|uniref:Uncharacterized protein n=1 Tax=Actinomadura keratinilytica TaxID=547461 RepID=A0ABP7Z853_9ACTN